MIDLIIIIAFLTSLILLILLRPIAFKLKLLDFPTKRKDHIGNVPLIGGICIYFGVIMSYGILNQHDKFSLVLLITSTFILIQGVWDDCSNVKAKYKMALQGILTVIVIYITDVKLQSFDNLFGVLYPLELGIFSIPITVISIVGLTNAINMIDGVDGLASSLILLAVIGLLCFNLKVDPSSLTNILFALAAALLPFMIFNIVSHSHKKIFLGDAGSLFLGFIISWVLIYNAENNSSFTPSFALWCVAIPLFDFFTVIILRIIEKRPLMIANRDHIHHFLKNYGLPNKKILATIVFFGVLLLILGLILENKFQLLSFPIFIAIFLLYLFLRIYNIFIKKVINY
ncbi:MraY family glycosyltransferase [Candidatus Levibacter sp. Uisw_134_01]|uniref:MraY family glycosyltransferase n=1 Tax=Candidatus Levibacter sp. Uisw_134_01 TaxID=3230999 RepID=UPI003D524B67